MTNQEINEVVARALGMDISPQTFIPPYSTSMAAAWDIVDFVTQDSLIGLELVQDSSSGIGSVWWAGFDTDRRLPLGDGRMVKADTAPMAICMAFLKQL